jgi:quercetin dioxygenase-like cupin family protein
MGKETFKANYLVHKENTSIHPSLLIFDLPTLVEKIKVNHSWASGELTSMILLKTPDKQIVLTALRDRTEIQSFQSNESITFQIIEGKLTFRTPKESVTLDEGQLLTLHENVKYSLTTEEETVFLLTIANSDLSMSVN